MDFMQVLLTPFVWLLMFFYNLFSNYGIALILFAIVVKLILFPFALKGKRSMIQMNMIQGKMQLLQKQYGKDKEKYNVELQKLYSKEKVNPMSGCLWSFIPLLILLPLYAIIRQPLTYMMSLTPDQIGQVAQALNWGTQAFDAGWIKTAGEAFANSGYNQLYLASLITPESLSAVTTALGEGTKAFAVNFSFIGLDLAQIPKVNFWAGGLSLGAFGLFLLPVISAGTGFLMSYIMMKTNAVNAQSQAAANNPSSKMMLFMSPLMSLWIGFVMPAGLCVYWIAQNVLSVLQEYISGKMLKKDYEQAAAARAESDRLEKEEEKRKKQEALEERNLRLEEAKNNKNKKKQATVKSDEKKETGSGEGQVGMRKYARGHAYDPSRYGGATDYREPGAAIDETVLEKAFKKESNIREEAAFELAADEAIMDAIDAGKRQDAAADSATNSAPLAKSGDKQPADELTDYDGEIAEAPYAEEEEDQNKQDKKD